MISLYLQSTENWTDYENRKRDNGEDPAFFSCNEAWEVFYLADKLQNLRPDLKKLEILEVIATSCSNETGLIPRGIFINRVAQLLESHQE